MTADKTNMDHAEAIVEALNKVMSEEWSVLPGQTNPEAGVTISEGKVTLRVSQPHWQKGQKYKLHIGQLWLHDDEGKMIEPYASKEELLPDGIERNDYGRIGPPGIDVSPQTKRGYKHVASHIQKRLYSAAFWFVGRCEYIRDQDSQYKRSKTELAIRLQKAAPTAVKLQTKVHHTRDRSSEIKYPTHLDLNFKDDDRHLGYGDIDASNKSADIKLHSLHPDLAVAILETIEKFYSEHRTETDPELEAEIEAEAAEFLATREG